MQCWSGRVNWEGFRAQELLRLVGAKTDLLWVRVDCADKYYDFVKLEDLLHPRTLFAVGMNGEALSPEHGAPLRLVMPAKYGYKSSKLITKLTFVDKGGMGLVADGWPYYSASGDILPGVDHPFEFPDETRKIAGGEITVRVTSEEGQRGAQIGPHAVRGGLSTTIGQGQGTTTCVCSSERESPQRAAGAGRLHGRLVAAETRPGAAPPARRPGRTGG